jgi:hypothetical protein
VKILLVHPEDSPCLGPWSREQWDLIVDFGKSSEITQTRWREQLTCQVLQLDSLRRGEADFEQLRQLTRSGNAQLVDAAGVDWWVLLGVDLYSLLDEALLIGRLCEQLDTTAELFSTRPGWPSSGVGLLLQRPVKAFRNKVRPTRLQHYGEMLRRFSFDQLAQIFFDKYDPRYYWRKRFAARRSDPKTPLVLFPSAYTNVSRMALAYARMFPEQQFLVVATRRSGTHFDPAPNVACESLAAYAVAKEDLAESHEMLAKWQSLKRSLENFPEMDLLSRAGLLKEFPAHLRDGLAVRNAWQTVLAEERVLAVMCGDDSNPNTRLPVMLARQQGIPTMDFHHGALDRLFLLKELSSDFYLAKGEMERDYLTRICHVPADRVVVAGPPRPQSTATGSRGKQQGSTIVFFSEPYETWGWRAEEIYREILPTLCKIARESGRKLIVKLHPFESRQQRTVLLGKMLPFEDAALVECVAGPFTPQLVANAWFAITVESTTVLDCSLLSVPCFVCSWLTASSPHGYARQYASFAVGRALASAADLENLPQLVAESVTDLAEDILLKPMDPAWFRRTIAAGACRDSEEVFPGAG